MNIFGSSASFATIEPCMSRNLPISTMFMVFYPELIEKLQHSFNKNHASVPENFINKK